MDGIKYLFFRKSRPLGESLDDFVFTERQVCENPKKLAGFVIIQIFQQGEKVYQIIKHDTAHGVYNVHRYYREPNEKEEYPKEVINDWLFDIAENDILQNWAEYREKYMRKWLSKY